MPARVFARPLELFPGKKISQGDIQNELQLLGYRRVSSPHGQGEFSASKKKINVYTRGYLFVDGREKPQKLNLRFDNDGLRSLENLDTGTQVPLVRLEPLEIAKIFPAHNEDRILVRLGEVPPFLIKALLTAEDRRFYQHHGVDPRGIARAFIANLKAMRIRQGASTLTQQLVKNLFLSNERTWWRKMNELIMALLLEYHYEKDEILEAYLNEVFLGQDNQRAIHGFGLAAEYYFDAPLNELRPDQLAMLVGMVKGPSYYDPRRHPKRAIKRRNVVISSMARLGLIDDAQKRRLSTAKLDVKPRRSLSRSRYPDFMDLVRQQLKKSYDEKDLRSEGLRIFTTLDPLLQEKSQSVLKNGIARLEKQKKLPIGKLQGAVIVLDIRSGEVQAVVGGRDRRKSGYNRAVQANRPIGSLVKPVVYLDALEKGWTLASPLKDEPVVWKDRNNKVWKPQNYDKVFHGETPLIKALVHSYNAATVWLGRKLGPSSIAKHLYEMGLDRPVSTYPSLLLGAVEMSPYEVSQVYQTMANDGFRIKPRVIRSVATKENQPLQRYELKIGRVIQPEPAYLIKFALTEVVRTGTARWATRVLPGLMPLAGKTGTTSDYRDSWFSGFGENTLTVVWLGRDDNKPTGLTGASGALRIWSDLMKSIPLLPVDLTPPEKIEWFWVNLESGRITDKNCPGAIPLPFVAGTALVEREDCRQSGQRSWKEKLFEGWLH